MRPIFNRALRILLVTNAMVLIAGATLGPIYALFVEKIGGNLLDASLAFSTFAVAAGIATLISGRYSDKIKETELILVLGYAIMGIGFLSYIWVNSILSLLIVQVIIGLGEAIYAPAFDAVYSRHLNGQRVGREWGNWEALNYFMLAFGAAVGGILVSNFGFNMIFVIMSLLCFCSALYIFLLPRKVL